MKKVYGVVFKNFGKEQYYLANDEYECDDLVIVASPRGELLGKVTTILEKEIEATDYIARLATDDDYNKYLHNLKDNAIALNKCNELINTLGLDMHVISSDYTLDRSQLLFNFTADNRVDFRELAKRLATIYHTRIELRQVGARDKAKEVGGVGICGGELCCARFLKKIDGISMNMAKEQNLALNPSKINGACGRLLCCLAYENDSYIENAKIMPKVGDIINTPKGDAQVISVDVLNHKCKVLIDGEKEDYIIDESSKK